MSATNNGGPAFPATQHDQVCRGDRDCHHGMTLRDYFAGQTIIGSANSNDYESLKHMGCLAVKAYALADAMIAERNKA